MMDDDKHSTGAEVHDVENAAEAAENNRRKLITKLAAGAFAVPAVLATLSRTAAADSSG